MELERNLEYKLKADSISIKDSNDEIMHIHDGIYIGGEYMYKGGASRKVSELLHSATNEGIISEETSPVWLKHMKMGSWGDKGYPEFPIRITHVSYGGEYTDTDNKHGSCYRINHRVGLKFEEVLSLEEPTSIPVRTSYTLNKKNGN